VQYAEQSNCRWRTLVDYFDKEDEVADHCGHCDRCSALSRR
jgi:superfamily II DNA helicase RecQ